jgi:hypothetical protein
LGDNSQDIYVAINYKPIRSLNLNLSYTNATKYNDYEYVRRQVGEAISQKPFNEKIWHNDLVVFKAVYEVVNNAYAIINVEWNNAQGYDLTSTPIASETRLTGQEYLNKFSPKFYHGENLTCTVGFSFGF